jgi:hypothetical protein
MRRPTGCAITWFVAFAVVLSFLLRSIFLRSGTPDILFPRKAFSWFAPSSSYANVYVAGTLTGESVGYKNNTTVVSCDRSRMECVTYAMRQIGPNQVGRVESPLIYPVITWTEDEVVASGDADAFHCRKLTISIVRRSEVALWVEEPINQASATCKDADTRLLKWTIEDSPGWKKLNAASAP